MKGYIVVDRPIRRFGDNSQRFGPQRMTDQAEPGRYVGKFVFAGAILEIFVKKDGSLYAKVPSGQMPIRLCDDGRVAFGKAPHPVAIEPSLKDALARM